MNIVDEYNKSRKVPCVECGMDLVEKTGAVIICNRADCRGILITRKALETWAKEQNKTLNH